MALRFELGTPQRLVRSNDVYMVVTPGTEPPFSMVGGIEEAVEKAQRLGSEA